MHKNGQWASKYCERIMSSLFRLFRHERRFVWQPDLDLSDPRVLVALIPFSMN
jgi:hypothetical protein